jgi:hypothetical protein
VSVSIFFPVESSSLDGLILKVKWGDQTTESPSRELDSTGKKIETDTTLDSLKLHIVLDKSSDITTFSSPLHKRMKPSDSPVHD